MKQLSNKHQNRTTFIWMFNCVGLHLIFGLLNPYIKNGSENIDNIIYYTLPFQALVSLYFLIYGIFSNNKGFYRFGAGLFIVSLLTWIILFKDLV